MFTKSISFLGVVLMALAGTVACAGVDTSADPEGALGVAADELGPYTPPPSGPTGPMCGGFASIQCPAGLICVDDLNDDCSPLKGAADCSGVCVLPDGTQAPEEMWGDPTM